MLSRLAPAKVNLFLHVGAPAGDGYHPISSLMVFADIGDEVSLEWGEGAALHISGPYAGALSVESDNLILRARDSLLEGRAINGRPYHLTLNKQLPIASGVGGGSADAAATLRLLREALSVELADDALFELASKLGSDVPACLAARPVIATGRGEKLRPAPILPDLAAVLVNPNLPSPTGAVYRAYDRAVVLDGEREPDWPDVLDTVEAVVGFLATCRNDLQPPAEALQPAIGVVLAELDASEEALFTRMSGSGATCFALCGSSVDAAKLADRLIEVRPDWWVRACTLRGS